MTDTASPTLPSRDDARVARARFVRDALKAERWSTRAAALAIGTNHTSLGARLKASTPFFAEDIESIAALLKRDPVEFYAAYLRAGTQKGPASEETGPGNVHPLGLEPRTHWIRDGRDRKPARPRNRADRSTGPKGRNR